MGSFARPSAQGPTSGDHQSLPRTVSGCEQQRITCGTAAGPTMMQRMRRSGGRRAARKVTAWKTPAASVAFLAVRASLKPWQVKRAPGHQCRGSRTLRALPAAGSRGQAHCRPPREAGRPTPAGHVPPLPHVTRLREGRGGPRSATSSRRAAAGTAPDERGVGSRGSGSGRRRRRPGS